MQSRTSLDCKREKLSVGQETKLNLVLLIISENKGRVQGPGQGLSRVRGWAGAE